MKERPIIFTAESVRAILGDRKTMTRRLMKPQPDDDARLVMGEIGTSKGVAYIGNERSGGIVTRVPCPYGVPGDRLWVRETWMECGLTRLGIRVNDGTNGKRAFYAADGHVYVDPSTRETRKWRSPIFMPRWASRITLEVTGVRVERLQQISEEDARAEGCATGSNCEVPGHGKAYAENSMEHFRYVWGSINAQRAPWASNQWVWVISFRRVA